MYSHTLKNIIDKKLGKISKFFDPIYHNNSIESQIINWTGECPSCSTTLSRKV